MSTWTMTQPFGFKSDTYTSLLYVDLRRKEKRTISQTTTQRSKFAAVIPIVGTAIAIYRLVKGYFEYKHFESMHAHRLAERSVWWMIRGAIELIPVIGALTCLTIDVVSSLLNPRGKIISLEINSNCMCRRLPQIIDAMADIARGAGGIE